MIPSPAGIRNREWSLRRSVPLDSINRAGIIAQKSIRIPRFRGCSAGQDVKSTVALRMEANSRRRGRRFRNISTISCDPTFFFHVCAFAFVFHPSLHPASSSPYLVFTPIFIYQSLLSFLSFLLNPLPPFPLASTQTSYPLPTTVLISHTCHSRKTTGTGFPPSPSLC